METAALGWQPTRHGPKVSAGADTPLDIWLVPLPWPLSPRSLLIHCPPLTSTVPRLASKDDVCWEALPHWPPGRLLIQEEGQRDHVLVATADGLRGSLRGAAVDVKVQGVELTGHLAGEPVWIWLRRREAEGHIGGHQVRFWLWQTPEGFLLRGDGVGHTIRFEESRGALHWLPSCERPLERLPRGFALETVYEGTCANGRRVRLTVPDELARMAPLPRLILLALLLTEREEGAAGPRLFPWKG